MKIKKGDEVVVLQGKDRGKRGRVAFAFPATGKVIVDGVNTATKHQKSQQNKRPQPAVAGGSNLRWSSRYRTRGASQQGT